jgi:SAM-dependent methyltransferase
MSKPKTKAKSKPTITRDKHALYEASVQDVTHEMNFLSRIFRGHRQRELRLLREDFCGTALLCANWVKRHPENLALGIDIDPEPLDWGLRHHIHPLGEKGRRVTLVQNDVLKVHRPLADLTCAHNFSYFLFKTRDLLRHYFKSAYRSLKPDGIFVLDAFGGLETMTRTKDTRKVNGAEDAFGNPIAPFTYEWEHAHFDVLTHDLTCHIHFVLANGRRLNRAFTYHWRLWTLPEIRELLLEAGFPKVEIYTHGWSRQGEGNSNYLQRKRYENANGWLAYLVAVK